MKLQTATGAVKINPLMASSSSCCDEEKAEGIHENPVFYGQITKIRKTKEREMISALLEVAENGIYMYINYFHHDDIYTSI